MGSLENRRIDELEPIAVLSFAELILNTLHRGYLAVADELRNLIVTKDDFLEVRQGCLGRL